jgi:hypothetical protein
MKTLQQNWLTEGLIDFEYKKYILLAYLQEVEKNFNDKKVYPFLGDLVMHYNNLVDLKTSKQIAAEQLPKQISRFDFEHFKVHYESLLKDNASIIEIGAIMDFAIPVMDEYLKEGRELYEFVEDKLLLQPIGILPLQPEEGYLLLRNGNEKMISIYDYHITIFESSEEKYRGIRSNFIRQYKSSITNTFEKIKIDLIRRNKALSNPGTFAVESKIAFPFYESMLPIAKRMLVRFIYREMK